MNRIIAWFVDNSVAANLLMAVLVVGGLLALPAIHLEEFPSIDTKVIQVTVEYLGAAPQEVADGVCVRIEEAVEGAEGIDTIHATAVEGVCAVIIELVENADSSDALDEIKNRIDGIDTFPEETETPVVSRLVMKTLALQIAVSGDADERTLKTLGQQVRDDIAALDGVSQVTLSFVRPYEISIEVSEDTLRRHGLTLDEVARAVRRSSLDLPGGSLKTRGGEILLRAKGQAYRGGEFEEVVVLTRPDGTTVRLGEIAEVVDGFRDDDLKAYLDGKPAVLVRVERVGDEDTLQIATAVKAYLEQARSRMPEGIELTVWSDRAADLEARVAALLGNARNGLVLVLLILALFLRFRLAVWVAAGVPIAFLGALMTFPAFGLAISTLSIMALILVLGIVVDDAIVVGENVYTHERRHEDQRQAAIVGTQEVYVPVIFGVLTTIAAFFPLTIVPGMMGDFFVVIGVTVIVCLIFSLIESQLILPAHLAHRRTRSKGGSPNTIVRGWTIFQDGVALRLEHFSRDIYRPFLERALEWRYLTIAIGVGVLILTASLFSSGRMGFQFFPAVEGNRVVAKLTMPRGTPVEMTEQAAARLESAAEELGAQIDGTRPEGEPSVIHHMLTGIGGKVGRDMGPQRPGVSFGGAYEAEVMLELIPAAERSIGSTEVARRWRAMVGIIPDAVELRFEASEMHAGEAINVQLRGPDLDELRQAAAQLRTELAGFPGVRDIADSFRAGKQEVKLEILPTAKHLGLTQDDLARQVRQAFYGQQVQRIQRGRGRCPRDGPLPAKRASVARRPGGHAHPHGRRNRGPVRQRRAPGARPRLRHDPAHGPRAGRERDGRRRSHHLDTRRGHGSPAAHLAPARPRRPPRCELRPRGRAAGARQGAGRPGPGLRAGAPRHLRAASGSAPQLRAAADHHVRDPVRRGRRDRGPSDHGHEPGLLLHPRHCRPVRRRGEREPGPGPLREPQAQRGPLRPGGRVHRWRGPLPPDRPHLLHHLHGPGPAHIPRRQRSLLHDPHGHLPRLRRPLRHHHHPDPRPLRLPNPGRPGRAPQRRPRRSGSGVHRRRRSLVASNPTLLHERGPLRQV